LKLKLLYFARLRESLGCASEELNLPASVQDVAGLLALLRERGGNFALELAPERAFRVAVDQEMAGAETRLHDGAEVAVFPPVTGG
jgi:molybdopterin synthase sulfur carrier subunit